MNITSNNLELKSKKFELEENFNYYLKDLANYIPNLLNYLWENPKLVATLLSNSNIKDIKEHLASFIVNNFYENIILSNSIENNLLYVFSLMLKEEINNLENENGPELFLNDNSRCYYLFKELIKKDNIRQYFRKVLIKTIENIESFSSEKSFNLKIKNLQGIVEKIKEKNLNESNDIIGFKKLNKSVKEEENEEKESSFFRSTFSYMPINESLNETKIYEEYEEINLEKFTEKYVSSLSINDIKKMIVEKYNEHQNIQDYCRNQLINCGQNIKNRDYYSNKIFMENLYCTSSSREVLFLYKNDFLKIIEFIDQIFYNIKNTIHLLPYPIKCICKIISTLINNKFPYINIPQKMAFLSQFFFNNLLIPILKNPGFSLLINNFIISKNTLNNIKIIIQIISQITSGKLFTNSEKNSDFTPFNWYFLEKITDIFEIVEDLEKASLPDSLIKLINNKQEQDYIFNYFNEYPEEDMCYRAICFNLYDIIAILNSMNDCKDEIFDNCNDLTFRKTFEKLNSITSKKLIEKLLNEENEKLKNSKPKNNNEIEENKVKSELKYFLITSLLTNDKYLELFNKNVQISKLYSMEINNIIFEEKTKNNILKVKNFLICLLYNYHNFTATDYDLIKNKNSIEILNILKEYSTNAKYIVNDTIPIEWYINSILDYLKKIPDIYAENDFLKLYEEIENELRISLKKIDFEIISSFFEKVKLAQRGKKYYNEISDIIKDLILNEKVQKIVEEEFIPFKLFFNYNNDKKEFYFKKSKMKEKDYTKKKAEKKKKKNYCKTIKSFTKKFPNLTLYEEIFNKNIFNIQTELNIPEKLSQYFNYIKEHLIINKKFSNSNDIELIVQKINDYVLNKIYKKIFPIKKDKKDEKIENKCKLLVWVHPKHFIKDKNYIYDCFLKDTIYFFNRIEIEKSPMKKIKIIKEIFNSVYKLVKFNGDNNNNTGVDDLMPILNYAFIKAKPEKIYSNLKFIELYIGELKSKEEGSQLTQLIALCDYIYNIEYSNLIGVTNDEFTLKCGIISLNLKINFE